VITVYVTVGNSDDKLTQKEWAAFVLRVHTALERRSLRMHGAWLSATASAWQNACWCVEVTPERVVSLKQDLRLLAREFRQDSIAWSEAPMVEFLGAPQ
jgi:hypothetical protein